MWFFMFFVIQGRQSYYFFQFIIFGQKVFWCFCEKRLCLFDVKIFGWEVQIFRILLVVQQLRRKYIQRLKQILEAGDNEYELQVGGSVLDQEVYFEDVVFGLYIGYVNLLVVDVRIVSVIVVWVQVLGKGIGVEVGVLCVFQSYFVFILVVWGFFMFYFYFRLGQSFRLVLFF